MVRKEDLLKIFFIYLCLCHVAPGHPCGNNPLRRFRPLSRMLGKDVNTLLNLLKESNPTLYRQVQSEWRLYADCVGLVDTGYFKRSDSKLVVPHMSQTRALSQQDRDEDLANMGRRQYNLRHNILYNLLNARAVIDDATEDNNAVRPINDATADTVLEECLLRLK